MAATLLAVAHGTADPAGQAEIRRLVDLVRAHRPSTAVELGWLERASPSAADVLGRLTGPVVVLPVLLSTGYHVKVDIQRLADGRPRTAVAAQLGPDRRLVEVVRQRLLGGRTPGADVVLFGAGSSDPEAFEQLTEAAAGLRRALASTEGTEPAVHPRFLTDTDGWRDGLGRSSDVANYLLAPGAFNDRLHARAEELAAGFVAPPIGAHQLVAELIWDRYDRAVTEPGLDSPGPAPHG
jgi:sirohydrochlorin ferrochelatase